MTSSVLMKKSPRSPRGSGSTLSDITTTTMTTTTTTGSENDLLSSPFDPATTISSTNPSLLPSQQQQPLFNPDEYELQLVEVMEIHESREVFLNYIQRFAIPETVSFLRDMWKFKEKRKGIYNPTTMSIRPEIQTENLQSSFSSSFSLNSHKKTVAELYRMAKEMISNYMEKESKYQLNVSSEVTTSLDKRWHVISSVLKTFGNVRVHSMSLTKQLFKSEAFESEMLSLELDQDVIKLPTVIVETPQEEGNCQAEILEYIEDTKSSASSSSTPPPSNDPQHLSACSNNNLEYESSLFVKCLGHIEDKNQFNDILVKLCQIFDHVEYFIYKDLAMEHFPKFKKSAEAKNFLLSKGEDFTKKIAINIKLGYEIDIRYKAKDFISPSITDKDIYFIIMLCKDDSWEKVTEKSLHVEKDLVTSYQVFTSSKKFLIGEEKENTSFKLAKVEISLPFSVEDSYKVIVDRQAKLKSDPMTVGDFETYKVEACAGPKKPLSMAYSSESYNLGKFSKNREIIFVQTLLHDRITNCYINLAKSAEFEEKRKNKERILVDIMYSYIFKSEGPQKCKLTYILFGDMKMAIDNDMFFKKFIKSRAKAISKGFTKHLNERTKHGTTSFGQVDDIFCLLQCLEQNSMIYPQRSWFEEFSSHLEKASCNINGTTMDKVEFLDFLDGI
ncbi:hypothetical protein C9374_014227 [Naegleria lovaniensis]|uniref:RGS domain-containing protein n=1 Tax=Naegleria lovaniensis TaxID=51637 RepID=A0AA88GB92_NAELO|nr:uncharacterized protein C9374_014227 [Naegleria lovaniensis]KAG2370769.1 hypothetical protein C9374_014227 [Naegleria lovaniensis]